MLKRVRSAVEDLEELGRALADPDAGVWRSDRVAVRCSADWARWLGGLSTWCRVPTAVVISQALYRFAEETGYNVPPPPRTGPGQGGGGIGSNGQDQG